MKIRLTYLYKLVSSLLYIGLSNKKVCKLRYFLLSKFLFQNPIREKFVIHSMSVEVWSVGASVGEFYMVKKTY